MTKTLTEQWREGTLESGWYYTKHDDGKIYIWLCFKDDCSYIENPEVKEILAPVPSYDKVKDISQKIERLEFDNEALETSRNELVQKIHILNEQNTKQYNELCEEIKKNNILEKKLEIATKALKETKDRLLKIELSNLNYEERHKLYDIMFADGVIDRALLEMEGVK